MPWTSQTIPRVSRLFNITENIISHGNFPMEIMCQNFKQGLLDRNSFCHIKYFNVAQKLSETEQKVFTEKINVKEARLLHFLIPDRKKLSFRKQVSVLENKFMSEFPSKKYTLLTKKQVMSQKKFLPLKFL